MILAKLVLAHLIGDFFLQTRNGIASKNEKKWKSPSLFIHTIVHFVLVLLLLWDSELWHVALIIAVSHYFIDGVKLTIQTTDNARFSFFLDQIAHFTVIIAVWLFFFEPNLSIALSDGFWITLTGIILVTYPASYAMQYLMKGWSNQIEFDTNNSLEGAGTYIGILERLFILAGILAGNIYIIGFLLAAKSIFRFGDLTNAKDRKLTEYILIGTLMSFMIAIATGFSIVHLIGMM